MISSEEGAIPTEGKICIALVEACGMRWSKESTVAPLLRNLKGRRPNSVEGSDTRRTVYDRETMGTPAAWKTVMYHKLENSFGRTLRNVA